MLDVAVQAFEMMNPFKSMLRVKPLDPDINGQTGNLRRSSSYCVSIRIRFSVPSDNNLCEVMRKNEKKLDSTVSQLKIRNVFFLILMNMKSYCKTYHFSISGKIIESRP